MVGSPERDAACATLAWLVWFFCFCPINEAWNLTRPASHALVIEAPIRNSVDPIAHKARNHQTLPNFALLPELCITKHSSNDTAHRRQNGTLLAAVTIDAQSTPLIPDLRQRSFRMFASARWQSSRLKTTIFCASSLCGEELGESYCVAISKKHHEHE